MDRGGDHPGLDCLGEAPDTPTPNLGTAESGIEESSERVSDQPPTLVLVDAVLGKYVAAPLVGRRALGLEACSVRGCAATIHAALVGFRRWTQRAAGE